VLIIGAGLGGSLLAVMLGRLGVEVRVLERRPDPRRQGFVGGRSINLALSARGLDALARAGLADRVLAEALPMRGRMMHGVDESLTFQPYSARREDAINSVSRGGLNMMLLDAAEACQSVSIRFGVRCEHVDLDEPAVVFSEQGRASKSRETGAAILGADGAFSVVRAAMQIAGRFDYSQSFLSHGYKELHIPRAQECGLDPTMHDGYAMDPGALHIWPRGGAMMIALPNPDRSFTCTLFWPYGRSPTGRTTTDDALFEHSFAHVDAMERVTGFFEAHYPDAVRLMPTLEQDYRRNPTSDLVTIRAEPWCRGRVALLGDAAHAIVPFYGQGMNAAFEDCVALVEAFERFGADVESGLAWYAERRKPHADAIADMALDNFIEMRDKVADPEFLHAKRIEQALHAAFPDKAQPQYNLVSFSTVPYATARRRGCDLERVVERVAGRLDRHTAAGLPQSAFDQRVSEIAAPMLDELERRCVDGS